MALSNKSLKNKKRIRGFSLIEVIIAVFIILVGFLTVLSLMSSSLKGLFDSRDQIIASLLAQESIELARNIRDNAWFCGSSSCLSFASFPSNNSSASECIIDFADTSIANANCGAGKIKTLYNNSGQYRSDDFKGTGTQTKFSRKIDIVYDSGSSASAAEATVTSMVIWGSSFPAGASDCNVANKCAYAKLILSRWGE